MAMRILIISYGDLGFDGRLRSLITAFQSIGEVVSFTRGNMPPNEKSVVSNLSYRKFISAAVKFAKSIGHIDILVLDNRKATIPGLLIKRKCHPTTVIQDCRELYLFKEVRSLSSKIGCVFEKWMAKRADIVICANQERAEIMKNEYQLNKLPLTYENLRELSYESKELLETAQNKLDRYFRDNETNIISSSGCSIERGNDVLVENLSRVNHQCRLFLVGDRTPAEEVTIRAIIERNNLSNVELIGRLTQTELKYLISKCQIGIVNYGQYDTNNKYCASGKIYEFIYEGLPVVTTTNPTLKKLCDQEKIGYADDKYAEGINRIIENYNEYKMNVKRFASNNTIRDNDKKLINQIRERLPRANGL